MGSRAAAATATGGTSIAVELKIMLIGFGLFVLLILLALFSLMMIGASAGARGEAGGLSCKASMMGKNEIPAVYMSIYRSAAAERDGPDQAPLGDRGVWILAAIHATESGFRSGLVEPIFGPPTDFGRALGPMQFLQSTWNAYGVDGNGDGRANPQDPEDAIPAAAKYLRASGAPANWHRAILAYNHADWYVQKVQSLADGYQGACTFTGGQGSLDGVQKVPASDPWLVRVPGTAARCDGRIVENVIYLVQRFKLQLGACYAPTGHERDGEHPLGLAIDVWPADGNWDNAMAAARFVGWSRACAAQGCPNPLARWIGYNGVADHGDPANCSGDCDPHLHISWNHAPAAYNTQADWVMVWSLPTEASL